MKVRTLTASLVASIVCLSSSAFANVLTNPGFEADNAAAGDVFGASGWGGFNDRFTTAAITPRSGTQTLKVFGPFSSGGGAGVTQGGFAAAAGQAWTASVFARNDSSDALTSGDFALAQLQFYNAAGAILLNIDSNQINDLSPQNVYLPLVAAGVAPAGTATAQIVLVKVQIDPIGGGSVFFDDASLAQGVIPEPASLAAIGLAGVGLLGRRRRA